MKYFDTLPDKVSDELHKRGVSIDKLLYCVKADLDGAGMYYDVYITFSKKTLYIISGYEIYQKEPQSLFGRKKHHNPLDFLSDYQVEGFVEYEISDIKNIYVDRYQNTARLMIADNQNNEFSLAQFSIGFSDKFEKFSQRVKLTGKNEEIDDTLLDAMKTHCPKCHMPYPDPNRPVCPKCVDKRSVFKRLLTMFWEFKTATLLILATIIISTGIGVLTPIFSSKMLYDDVLAKGGKYYGQILMIVIIIASIGLAEMVLKIISGVITSKVIPVVTHKLRLKIFSSMQNLSVNFFTSKQTGSLMARVDRDSENIYWFFTDIMPYGITNIVKITGCFVAMVFINPILSMGILFSIAVIQFAEWRFFKGQRNLYRKHENTTRSANAVLSDAMNGQRVVKAFASEGKEVQRYNSKNKNAFEINYKINDRVAHSIPLMWTFFRIVERVFLFLGAFMVIKGYIAFGALTALLAYSDMTFEPMHFFTWIGHRMSRCIDAASRMFEIIDSKPTVAEAENPIRIQNMKGDIKLNNISFEYEAGHPIIKGISIDVRAGEMFGIVGKTGAGKSTIINLIARLYDVTGGEITIDGIPLKNIAFEDLRKNIGIVSQETFLFMGTIAENIKYANQDATMEQVVEAAKSANAHEFICKLPDAYNTKIGEGGVALSGGERQRISIARAIIQKPNILILDEATASMDTRTERKIQAAIDQLKTGRTIISIAHRLSTLRDADMLCVIENGELKETGTHNQLIRSKGKYFELYKLQSEALQFINMGE